MQRAVNSEIITGTPQLRREPPPIQVNPRTRIFTTLPCLKHLWFHILNTKALKFGMGGAWGDGGLRELWLPEKAVLNATPQPRD